MSHEGESEHEPKFQEERLSDIELGDLLASVGNNEAKALTLILMSGGNLYTARGIQSRLINAQGKNPAWKMGINTQFRYCQMSFEPIGLVAKETVDENLNTYGYQITEKGENLGIPLAGLLLDFCTRHDVSLQDLFGATTSQGRPLNLGDEESDVRSIRRSPLARFKIFYELVTNPDSRIRKADIIKNLDLFTSSAPLAHHLDNLRAIGIIGYDSIGAERATIYYSLIPEKMFDIPTKYQKSPALTQNVFATMKGEPEKDWSIEELDAKLKDAYPDYEKATSIRNTLSGVLVHLRETGFLKVRKFSGKERFQSEITLNNEQKELLSDLVNILDNFTSKDPQTLTKGRGLAFGIASDHEKVRKIMAFAKEHSPGANSKSVEERQDQLLSIMGFNPGITIREMTALLQRDGELIHSTTVGNILKQMSINGKAMSKKQKGLSHWYITSEAGDGVGVLGIEPSVSTSRT